MAGVEIKHFGYARGGARIPYTNNAQNRRAGRVGQTYQADGRVFYWRFLELGTSKQPATPFYALLYTKTLNKLPINLFRCLILNSAWF